MDLRVNYVYDDEAETGGAGSQAWVSSGAEQHALRRKSRHAPQSSSRWKAMLCSYYREKRSDTST
jgi:hypothetical protein